MSDPFAEMREHLWRLWAPSNDARAPDGRLVLDWRLEVMDRIEAIERFLDRADED